MKILIVDDDEEIQRTMKRLLSHHGHLVATMGDGNEALTYLRDHPDTQLVLSDIRMPGIDGIQFVKTASIRHPRIPVILMTGLGNERMAMAAFRGGAYDYLKKPIQFDELLAYVEQIDKARELEEKFTGESREVG